MPKNNKIALLLWIPASAGVTILTIWNSFMTSLLVKSQNETIFDAVRQGFAFVSEKARHVKIREDLIPAYADSLPSVSPNNVLDEDHHFIGGAESTAAYILALDSINFGSGYQSYMVDEGWQLIDNSLYFTISTRLKHYFEQDGSLTALDRKDICKILQLNENGRYSAEFAQLCADSLQELEKVITGQYNGSFLNLVRAADNSAEKIVVILASMHHFNDVHQYHGAMIPFYKRAQITAADLHLAFARLGETLFNDIDQLTMFPDNGVPHVFVVDGLLEYSDDLAGRIARGEEIASGSDEEIEIRACAGHAVEMIAAHKNMIAMNIDHILWHKSVEDPRYDETPSHRTCSQFY